MFCQVITLYQILMSVWLTRMIVNKSVLTPLDHFSAAALKGILSLLMINLVSTLMNAQLVHTTASNSVSTPMEDTSVAATQATSSTLMEGTVLVCMYTPMIIA